MELPRLGIPLEAIFDMTSWVELQERLQEVTSCWSMSKGFKSDTETSRGLLGCLPFANKLEFGLLNSNEGPSLLGNFSFPPFLSFSDASPSIWRFWFFFLCTTLHSSGFFGPPKVLPSLGVTIFVLTKFLSQAKFL